MQDIFQSYNDRVGLLKLIPLRKIYFDIITQILQKILVWTVIRGIQSYRQFVIGSMNNIWVNGTPQRKVLLGTIYGLSYWGVLGHIYSGIYPNVFIYHVTICQIIHVLVILK